MVGGVPAPGAAPLASSPPPEITAIPAPATTAPAPMTNGRNERFWHRRAYASSWRAHMSEGRLRCHSSNANADDRQ